MKLLDISILIPCFNASSTIKRCVNSILQQNYPIDKIKIICIDDGSTDNTWEILQNYQQKFGKIFEIYTQENKGVCGTRNNLIKKIKTSFFIFLDSDDFFLPNAFLNLVKSSKKGKHVVTVAKTARYFENKKRSHIWWLTTFVFKGMSSYRYLLWNQPFLWNMLINTDFFKSLKINFSSKINYAEDLTYGTIMLANCKKIGVSCKKTYGYVRRDNSLSDCKTNKTKNVKKFLEQMDNFFVLTKENTSKKWIIFKKNYVFLVAIYLVSTFFLFPKFYKYEKPNNVLWEETKKDFLQIVDKWDQKICCPKGFWRIFSYFVFVKRKFKHLK